MTLAVVLGCDACLASALVQVEVRTCGQQLIADDEQIVAWTAAHHLPTAACP